MIFRNRHQQEILHLEQNDRDAEHKTEAQRYCAYGDIFRHKVKDGIPVSEADVLFGVAAEQYCSALVLEPNNFVARELFSFSLSLSLSQIGRAHV